MKPWATIRVLDAEEYAESLTLDTPEKEQGVTLEAPGRATLLLSADRFRLLVIDGVPGIRVCNFRFREARARRGSAYVPSRGRSPGCVLHGLDLLGSPAVDGVRVHGLSNLPGEPPLVIERCSVRGAYDAILVRGPMPGAGGAIRTS